MDVDKLKQRIMILLGAEAPVKEKVKESVELTESKLIDGTNISYDKLEIGSNFLIRTASDTAVPAPMGEYTLPDGTIISIGETNLITKITPANEVEPGTEVETPEVEVEGPKVEVEGPEVEVEPEADPMAILNERISVLEEIIKKFIEDQTAMSTELKSQIVELANAPAATPVFMNTNTKEDEKSVLETRMEFLNKNKR